VERREGNLAKSLRKEEIRLNLKGTDSFLSFVAISSLMGWWYNFNSFKTMDLYEGRFMTRSFFMRN
jgi:hypothetical protein